MSNRDNLSKSWNGIDDVVIVGGGLAGLFCALKLAPRPVTILAAAPIGFGASSAWAQGGIAAAMSEGDTVEKHLIDTLEAGGGIVDENIARIMATEGPDRIRDLLEYGVPFDRDLEGKLELSREAAHSERRIVRVKGDMAGRAIMDSLVAAVRKTPSIRVMEGYVVEELQTSGRTITGVVSRPDAGQSMSRVLFPAKSVVLCTGGIGHIYNVTTNPPEARGGGVGMAARAGAIIADAEFVQFHPTAINVGRDPAPLATEALRGDGAILVDHNGHRFMTDLHEDAEMAPRDIVARGIYAQVQSGKGAFLDCRKAIGTHFEEEFPTVFNYCMCDGINPVTDVIPVVPAVHYHMGGVLTDALGRTSIDGLWAAGEVTSTGVHGANRLASNSLLEAVVFAGRIAENIQGALPMPKLTDWGQDIGESDDLVTLEDSSSFTQLRIAMSDHVGVIRHKDGLIRMIKLIAELERNNDRVRFSNILTTAKMIAVGAFLREESRGGHFRSDFPDDHDHYKKRSFSTLGEMDKIVADIAEKDMS